MTAQQLRRHYQVEFDKWMTLFMQRKINRKQLKQKAKKYFPLIEMYHQLEIKKYALHR